MLNTAKLFLFLLMSISISAMGEAPISASPPGAQVYFITPANGQTLTQTFKVKFGLSGMGVAPAGTNREKTGHHHLLIDTHCKQFIQQQNFVKHHLLIDIYFIQYTNINSENESI